MVAQSPARELIETPGFLDESNLARELRSCDAVVLPYERRRVTQALSSASAALLDVLSTGTPVVASRVRSLEGSSARARTGCWSSLVTSWTC